MKQERAKKLIVALADPIQKAALNDYVYALEPKITVQAYVDHLIFKDSGIHLNKKHGA